MVGTSHGSAYGESDASVSTLRVGKQALTSGNCSFNASFARADKPYRPGSLRWWIASFGQAPASVPVVSRARWTALVGVWLDTEAGLDVLARYHVSGRRFIAVATAIARHGHGGTGRFIAVTNRRIASEAGYSESTVTIVRRILLSQGWLYKSAEGVSSRSGRCNRPAIVHLTTPRPAANTAAAVDNSVSRPRCAGPVYDPLRSGSSTYFSTVSNNQTRRPLTRRHKARKPSPDPHRRQRWADAFRLADELMARTTGLGPRRRPLASALALSALDLPQWSGQALKSALDASAQQHRWDWPVNIANPGAFLAWRLRQLPAAPETTPVPPQYTANVTPVESTARAREAAKELLRDMLVRKRRARISGKEKDLNHARHAFTGLHAHDIMDLVRHCSRCVEGRVDEKPMGNSA